MKKIYCLGLHKTGSTSLQRVLLANQVALARRGVLFPPVTPQAVTRFMADLLRPSAARSLRLNDYMGHNALAYQMISERVAGFAVPQGHLPTFASSDALFLAQDLAEHLAAQTLVFCSEDLARAALMAPDVPRVFAERFGADDVTIFAVVRRPDEALAAWQTQKLRFGQPFAALRQTGVEPYFGTVHLEYRAALEPWLRAFPTARIVLAPYGEVKAAGGTVERFFQIAGLATSGLTGLETKANPSLPHAVFEIARLALAAIPLESAKHLRAFLARAAEGLALPVNSSVDMLGGKARGTLLRGFEDTHHWLSQTSGRVPFFPDISQMAVAPDMTATDAAVQALPALRAKADTELGDPVARAFLAGLSEQALQEVAA